MISSQWMPVLGWVLVGCGVAVVCGNLPVGNTLVGLMGVTWVVFGDTFIRLGKIIRNQEDRLRALEIRVLTDPDLIPRRHTPPLNRVIRNGQ